MANAKDISLKGYKLKAMIYGASGTGKTTFGGSWPHPFFADFDGGMLSLRGRDVEYEAFQDMFRGGICYSSGWDKFNEKLMQFEAGKWNGVETVVVDSITIATGSAIWTQARLNNHEWPTLKDYGTTVEPIKKMLTRLKALPCNILFIAHEELLKVEDTGELLIVPFFMGSVLLPFACDLFDEIYRAEVGKDKDGKARYKLMTQATSRYRAKSRLGLPAEIEPNYTEILNFVTKQEKIGRKEE